MTRAFLWVLILGTVLVFGLTTFHPWGEQEVETEVVLVEDNSFCPELFQEQTVRGSFGITAGREVFDNFSTQAEAVCRIMELAFSHAGTGFYGHYKDKVTYSLVDNQTGATLRDYTVTDGASDLVHLFAQELVSVDDPGLYAHRTKPTKRYPRGYHYGVRVGGKDTILHGDIEYVVSNYVIPALPNGSLTLDEQSLADILGRQDLVPTVKERLVQQAEARYWAAMEEDFDF